jgi:hypothetical protein
MTKGSAVWVLQAMPVKIASTKAAINLISTLSDVESLFQALPGWGSNPARASLCRLTLGKKTGDWILTKILSGIDSPGDILVDHPFQSLLNRLCSVNTKIRYLEFSSWKVQKIL